LHFRVAMFIAMFAWCWLWRQTRDTSASAVVFPFTAIDVFLRPRMRIVPHCSVSLRISNTIDSDDLKASVPDLDLVSIYLFYFSCFLERQLTMT
jgi:hypothetical protein